MYNNTGLNKVILVGYITQEPRLHNSKNAKSQLSFTLSTLEIIKTQNGSIEHTEYHVIKIDADHNCLKSIELKKDLMVYIQGKLHTQAVLDDQQRKHYITEVIANSIELFSYAPENNGK